VSPDVIERICSNYEFIDNCWAEGSNDLRIRTNIVRVCSRGSIELEDLVAAFTQYTPIRYADVEIISQSTEFFLNAVECTIGSPNFLPLIGREWTSLVLSRIVEEIPIDWIANCYAAAVTQMITEEHILQENATEDEKRGFLWHSR
jgi:hypothetical protein